MRIRTRTSTTMAKKAAKKPAKKKAPRDGNDPNALGLEGRGVEVPRIASLTKKINEYLETKDQRCKLTPIEVKQKQAVIQEMEKHADTLRNPNSGNLEYAIDDKHTVVIEPAKVTIKVKDATPKKKKAAKDDQTDLEPEQQEAMDQQD